MSRPERLVYMGKGREFRYGVPARDLEPEDIALIDDETLAEITGPHPETGKALYEVPKAAAKPAPKADTGKEG